MMFSKNKGFSLIEILVGLGLLSILSLGLAQVVSNFNNDIKKSENKFSELALASQLSQIISDKASCKKAMDTGSPQVFTGSALLDLKFTLPSGQVIFKDTKYGNQLLVKEFYIKDIQTPIPLGSGLMKVIGGLYLKTEDISIKSIPRKEKNIGILQLVYNSTTNEIVECFGNMNDPKMACESLGFVWNTSKSTCQQDPSQACTDLGGTWSGSSCSVSQVANQLSILNKSCAANQYLYGFDSNGSPKCQTIATPPPATPPPATPPPATPPPATPGRCSAGYTDIDSLDGTRKCHFEWAEAAAGTSVNCSLGISCSAGGYGSGRCDSDGNWVGSTYTCSNASGSTCPGGSDTKTSADLSNTCVFSWNQGSEGENLVVTTNTNGGTLSGKCNSGGVWTFSYNCPGKTVTCPAGNITVGRCNFAYDNTAVGKSAANLRDLNGIGSASGCTCQANGAYDTNSCNVSSNCLK